MESNSWTRFALAASKRHGQSTVQSRYASAGDASRDPSLRGFRDLFLGFEEVEGDVDDSRVEYACPFCAEDFDMVGLCCHIDDEHPIEAKNGVCPVCTVRVGQDLVGHMMTQHGSFFKMQRRRRYRKGSSPSHSMLSMFRKDLREGNLQALLGGSSLMVPPSAAPDPLLSSLIYTLPMDDSPKDVLLESRDDGSIVKKTNEKLIERVEPSLSDKDQKERAQRSEFVQGLVLSTIFNDIL